MIDYENVGSNGIVGCQALKETDHIHLFYTENAKRISLDFFENHGDAELVIHKVPVRKQSLDMHLVSYLGYLIGGNVERACSYRIISQDTDYDNIIKFWKQEKGVEVARVASIKAETARAKRAAKKQANKADSGSGKAKQAANSKSTAKAGQRASTGKAGQSAGGQKQGVDDRTRLNNEIQQVLSRGDFANEVVTEVAKLAVSLAGEEPFSQRVHNELQTKYDDYSDIYVAIKPVLDKYSGIWGDASPQVKGGAKTEEKVDNTALNSQIQKAMSKAGMPPEVIGFVASTVVKNVAVKNGKQITYRSIISKFGQKQGLDIYRTVRKYIP